MGGNGGRGQLKQLNSTSQGTIYFFENDEGVLVRGQISGLLPGDHGFHVHMEGNLGDGCVASGAHFNPFNVTTFYNI